MNGPRIISPPSVDLPIPPTSVEKRAMEMSREQALDITDARRGILRACAYQAERWTGQVFWPGASGARACTSEMILDAEGALGGYGLNFGSVDGYGSRLVLPACPELQNLSTDSVSITSVQVWDAGAYVDPPEGHEVLPGGRVMVNQPGIYKVVASLTAPPAAPEWAIDGLCRYFGWRERRRPAEEAGGGGDLDTGSTQAGGLMKSGAGRNVARRTDAGGGVTCSA